MGLLGLLFFAIGIGCIALGSMIINRYDSSLKSITDVTDIRVPAIILIVVGFVLFFAGLSGFCNTCRENKCCLGSFFAFLLLVFILLITAASLSAVYRTELNSSLAAALNKSLYEYPANGTDGKNQVDDMQIAFKCCGVNGSTDWLQTPYGKAQPLPSESAPKSCYPDSTPAAGAAYPGCYSTIKSFFDSNYGYIIGGTVGFLVILALGMIGSCALIYYRRNEEKYFTLS
jgi:multisubunit Na+/H+ antiporter MnhG subunit